MKRIVSIVLAVLVLFGSVALAEESTSRNTQEMWKTVYNLMELVGENPTKDQFTQVTMYCIIARYEDLQSEIERNRDFYENELPKFGSFLTEDMLQSYISIQTSSLEYEYRSFYSVLLYCASCYEKDKYAWGGLKRFAYVGGFYGTDSFDDSYVDTLPILEMIGQ